MVLLWEEVICQRQTPIVRDLCGEALVPFIADLGNDVVVEGELVVGRNDQIRIDIPDLEKQSYQLFARALRGMQDAHYVRAHPDSAHYLQSRFQRPSYLHSTH